MLARRMCAPTISTRSIFLRFTYQWLPRFSTVTSYTFQRVKYADASIGADQDRMDNTFGETIQFSLTRRTNLVGDYRYQITDYDTAPIDSTTHSLLGGVDHHLTEHLVVHARGGSIISLSEGRW